MTNKSMAPKLIAMYLPQFHVIHENEEFWGKGFTDWQTVKNAKPLFSGHYQPNIPLNNNYYDLSCREAVEWQCKLAHENGIYGFGVYHYWFNDDTNLLTRPAEIMRDSNAILTKYFFTWDNCSWVRSWSNVRGNDWSPLADAQQNKTGPKVLIPYILGNEDNWEKHYREVKSHFLSDNYLKVNNKPVFGIINYSEDIVKMCKYWDSLAKQDGFDGIFFIYKYRLFIEYDKNSNLYNYEPHYSAWGNISVWTRIKNAVMRRLNLEKEIYFYDYDKTWNNLLKNAMKHNEPNFYHGAFVCYDDSPRRGRNRSRVVTNATPEKFEMYLSQLLNISKEQGKEFIFLTAWNEWSEGAYLEPDERNRNSYLKAIRNAVSHLD